MFATVADNCAADGVPGGLNKLRRRDLEGVAELVEPQQRDVLLAPLDMPHIAAIEARQACQALLG